MSWIFDRSSWRRRRNSSTDALLVTLVMIEFVSARFTICKDTAGDERCAATNELNWTDDLIWSRPYWVSQAGTEKSHHTERRHIGQSERWSYRSISRRNSLRTNFVTFASGSIFPRLEKSFRPKFSNVVMNWRRATSLRRESTSAALLLDLLSLLTDRSNWAK